MKSIRDSNIPILIGIINLILVLTTIVMIYANLGNPSAKLQIVYILLIEYIKYSFIPALISISLTRLSSEKLAVINYSLNILYLVVYLLVFLILRNIQLGV